jgi:hypothetical protein
MVKLADEIFQLISDVLRAADWSSANPQHSNQVKNINPVALPDLEESIESAKDTDAQIAQEKQQKKVQKTVEGWEKGHVGRIQRMSQEQFGMLMDFVDSPFQFIVQNVFGRAAKGAGIAALAAVFFGVVQAILNELLKPGRALDRRFRRDINKEILAFRSREEKQKLRQGKTSIIVTSIGGLRGGQGQVSSNLRAYAGVQAQPIQNNFAQPSTMEQASGLDLGTTKGKRGRFRA